MRKTIAFAVLLAVSTAVPAVPQGNTADSADVVVRKQRQEFVAGMNARDPDRVFALAADDLVLLAEGQSAVEGLANFREMLRQMLASGMTWELRMETTRVEYSGGLAVELGRYWKTRRLPDGTSRSSKGKYVDVWKRQPNGRWLLIVHAPSDDPPPAAAKP